MGDLGCLLPIYSTLDDYVSKVIPTDPPQTTTELDRAYETWGGADFNFSPSEEKVTEVGNPLSSNLLLS